VGAAPQGGKGRQQRFPRTWRISGSQEIRNLFHRGKRSRTAHLDVFDSTSPEPHPRVGLVVPKHKQTSVKRNRLKRQLREIIRIELLPRLSEAQVYADLLVRARKEAYQATFGGLREELMAWVEQRWGLGSSSS
jgi:ribonuclease P protein component